MEKGRLMIIGSIDVAEECDRVGHYAKAMLIEFDSAESLRKAVADGQCEFEFLGTKGEKGT